MIKVENIRTIIGADMIEKFGCRGRRIPFFSSSFETNGDKKNRLLYKFISGRWWRYVYDTFIPVGSQYVEHWHRLLNTQYEFTREHEDSNGSSALLHCSASMSVNQMTRLSI